MKQGLVDRLIVSVAPKLLGRGTEGIGDLGVRSVTEGLTLADRSVHVAGSDILIAGTVVPVEANDETEDVEQTAV